MRRRQNVLRYLEELYPRMPERAYEVIGYTGRLNKELIRSIPDKKRVWWMRELLTTRWIDVRDAMAIEIIRFERLDVDQFGEMYRSDQKKPGATLTVMLKNPIFALDLKQQIEKVLEEQGLTNEYLIGKLKQVIEISELKGDLTNMRHAIMDTLKITGAISPAKPMSKSGRLEQANREDALAFQDTHKMLEQANLDDDIEDADIIGYDAVEDEDEDEEI